jgi:rhodanese-related sulfurtransferase/rubrerythrin
MKLSPLFTKVDTLSAEETKKLLSEKKEGEVKLIDVREPQEYEEGHLPGAELIPLSQLLDRIHEIDSSKTTVMYCRMGNRSSSAAALVRGQGLDNVYSMIGGITAWNGIVASGQLEAGMFLFEGTETPAELVSTAWKLEDGTRKFYEQTRDVLADEKAKQVFDALVNAEQKHKETLSVAYKKATGKDIKDALKEKVPGNTYMESGVPLQEAVTWLKEKNRTLQDILEYSMQLEANSLDLYLKINRDIKNPDTKKIIPALIEDEKAHLSRMGKLIGSKATGL